MRHKRDFLEHLIRDRDMRQVLVFTRTKISATRLARELLRDGYPCAALHSDRTQQERMRALADFKDGKLQLLVATDIAARGLDIEQLPHVINYELPHNPEDYIHRIGRTGRAGQPGEAISLVAPDEEESLASIERLLKARIPISAAPDAGRPGRHGTPDRESGRPTRRAPSVRESGRSERRARPARETAQGAPAVRQTEQGAPAAREYACAAPPRCASADSRGPMSVPRRWSTGPERQAAPRARQAGNPGAVPAAGGRKAGQLNVGRRRRCMDTSEPSSATVRFRELIDRPDEQIDLAEAALLIAKNANHNLDVGRYLARIDQLADALSRAPAEARPATPSASSRSTASCSRSRDSGPTSRTTTICATASSTRCSSAGSASRSACRSCTWRSVAGSACSFRASAFRAISWSSAS